MTATIDRPFDHWSDGRIRAEDVEHIPGDAGARWIGNTLRLLKDPIKYSLDMCEAYGPVFKSHIFGDWNVTMLGAEANELVLRNKNHMFSNEQGWGPVLDHLFGGGLMLMDFEEHRMDRRALAVAFAKGPLEQYCAALNSGMARDIASWWGDITFYPKIKKLALLLAAESFVGLPWGEEAEKINKAFVGLVQASVAPIRTPLPFTPMKAGLDGRAYLVEYFTAECERRRRDNIEGDDIFSRFAMARREDGELLATREVVDQMIFLMMAAHDTITSSATSVVYQLAKHPEWQQKVREEIWSVTGAPQKYRGPTPLAFEQLNQLPLTEMVFKEALRMRPPLPAMPRRAFADFEFGGYTIPAGTRVGLDIHYTHYHAEYWEDPYRFNPYRFEAEAEKEHTGYAWIPFGGGAHKCLGLRFADMQIKLLLAHLLGRFEISADQGYEPSWQVYPIQKPKDGLRVRVEPL